MDYVACISRRIRYFSLLLYLYFFFHMILLPVLLIFFLIASHPLWNNMGANK